MFWLLFLLRKTVLMMLYLLNAAGRVCEATSSNLFVIKDEKIFTPSVSRRLCRRCFKNSLLLNHFKMEETQITVEQLATADSVFLSNSIQGDTC
jgi:4-amino-4-deoxychorismate lyase